MVLRLAMKGGSAEATALKMPYYERAADSFSERSEMGVEMVIRADNDLTYGAQVNNGELEARELLKDLCSADTGEKDCVATARIAQRKDAIEYELYSSDLFSMKCTEMELME